MSDQHRYAIGRAHRHPDAGLTSDQRVSLLFGDRLGGVFVADLRHACSVDLSLLKPSTGADDTAEPLAVLTDRALVVPNPEAEVQRRKGGTTHATCPRCKRVTESMSVQKG